MKRYFFLIIFIGMYMHAMDNPQETCFDLMIPLGIGKNMHAELACRYLKHSPIDFKSKYIIDIGCKDGEITHGMVDLVGKDGIVMGIDPDKEMIEQARKNYPTLQNLSFHEGSEKNFEPSSHSFKFHVATVFNSFDLIENKREFCKKIHACLRPEGEFLVNMGSGKEPFDFEVTRKMVAGTYSMMWLPGYNKLEEILKESYLTEENYRDIFEESGFAIISLTRKMGRVLFKTKEEFAGIKRPIFMGQSIIKMLPTMMVKNWLFNKFIEKFLMMLEHNEDGNYIYPIEEIVIHARKVE